MKELTEVLEVVDENNQVVGSATRGECYEKGLLHRAVNIFVFNSQGEVFIHQRSEKKLKYRLFWDLSCSEHIKPGESFEGGAKRGLQEELGIQNISIEEVVPLHKSSNKYQDESGVYFDNELVVTFKVVFDGKLDFDPNEVRGGKFYSVAEVNGLIKSQKTQFTPWFLEEWEMLRN